jgi:hypothetical protein
LSRGGFVFCVCQIDLFTNILKTGLSTLQGLNENEKMKHLVFLLFITPFITSCSFFKSKIDSRKQKEVQESTNGKLAYVPADDPILMQIRIHEKQMKNQREIEHYSKLLPWFKSDQERLDYLRLGNLGDKQQWALDKKMWGRSQNPNETMKTMIITGDIAIGMPMDFVLKSWGTPQGRETSGHPLFKNEKWKYLKQISTREGYKQEKRLVYFEGGRVVGWETD